MANFSSFGPTLDGRIKPDISAPGVNVASSISSFTDDSYSAVATVPFQGRNYPFARFSGTSMAAPAATGTVALMLEADPTLTPADIRDIIRSTARTDNFTGTIPPGGSTRWGMGKVNAYHAVTQVLGTAAMAERGRDQLSVWPNPAQDRLFIELPDHATGTRLTVRDALGRTVLSRTVTASGAVSLDASAWAPGLYLVRLEGGTRLLLAKVMHE